MRERFRPVLDPTVVALQRQAEETRARIRAFHAAGEDVQGSYDEHLGVMTGIPTVFGGESSSRCKVVVW